MKTLTGIDGQYNETEYKTCFILEMPNGKFAVSGHSHAESEDLRMGKFLAVETLEAAKTEIDGFLLAK